METRHKAFVVWGAGGHGRMVADLVRSCGHAVLGYADRDRGKVGQVVDSAGARVLYHEEDLIALALRQNYPDGVEAFALGIGDNNTRQMSLCSLEGLNLPSLVHPTASVNSNAILGQGTVVFPHAVINVGSSIGPGAIVNTGAIIEHDCALASCVHISPGAILCGGVKIGERTWVGAGAIVIHGIQVGDNSIIGAGSTVVRDVANSVTVFGCPARPDVLDKTHTRS